MGPVVLMFCVGTGFAASGAISCLYQLIAAERADFLVDKTSVGGNVVAVLLSMFGGPYILARNAVWGARSRSIPPVAALVMAAVAVLWSACAGIVYLGLLFSA